MVGVEKYCVIFNTATFNKPEIFEVHSSLKSIWARIIRIPFMHTVYRVYSEMLVVFSSNTCSVKKQRMYIWTRDVYILKNDLEYIGYILNTFCIGESSINSKW